jgi:hypothetical protein
VQRAAAYLIRGIFRDYDVAGAPSGFQAGWSDCMYLFSLFLFILFAHLIFRVSFCTQKGKLAYRSSNQMFCREEVGVFFVALGILEPQTARHWFQSAAISRNLTNSVGGSLL